jgi:hypothetical protein
MSKRFGSHVVMSQDAAVHVEEALGDWQRHEVEVRGRVGTMTVVMPRSQEAAAE